MSSSSSLFAATNISSNPHQYWDRTYPDLKTQTHSTALYKQPLPLCFTADIRPSTQAGQSKQQHVIGRTSDSCMRSELAALRLASRDSTHSPVKEQSYIPASEQYSEALSATRTASAPWSMQFNTAHMGVLGNSSVNGLRSQNLHQRASSTSSIASNGPDSPYSYSPLNPHIANTDVPPFDYSQDLAFSQPHTPIDPAYLSAHLYTHALPKANQRLPSYLQNYTHSMSGSDRAGSSTPSSGVEEPDTRSNAKFANGESSGRQNGHGMQPSVMENRALHPHVQLSRTESAAYQDELYNPADFASAPTSASKPAKAMLQGSQRTLVNQYLESANMARSVSPNSVSRERSPFREGAELAPTEPWNSPRNPIQTAASRRQQIKMEREQAELAAHRPQLNREPTKTISPKDALLDYNESDQTPLIEDIIPAGYKQHLGGTEPYADATPIPSLKAPSYNLPLGDQQKNMAGFRAANNAYTTPNFTFSPPNSQTTATMPAAYQMAAYQQLSHLDPSYGAASMAESTPQFPAQLTSMESSMSDQAPPMSSQESMSNTSVPRPADTRANAGTYTCTYHGCAQRFESPNLLQKHKKEYHRSQQQQQVRENLSAEASSESPRSTASPGPSGSGLTSAEILARNSQAGPHKCTRTNPSTGKPCNTVFSRPYDLTRHEDTIHNGRKHKVRCPYCREEKTFSRNDALTRHMRVVHPDVENYGKRGRRND